LRTFTSNVRGLVKNWDAIQQIDTNSYDIILLNEIWQIKDFENISIENFEIANIYQRENQRGGGVIIYIKKDIKYEKFDSPIEQGLIETTSIKVENNIFTSLYRPPSGNKQLFCENLTEWISSLNNKNIYLAGDFNINNLNHERMYFNNIEASTGLVAKITNITRIQSDSCIDNILTNLTGNHKVSTISIADHQGLISSLETTVNRISTEEKFKYRLMKEQNWQKFKEEVTKLRINGNNIDEKWSNLCSDIKSAVDKSFPIIWSKKKYEFDMSRGLLKSKNKKNKLLQQYKRGQIAKETYIAYNKVYR